MYAVEFKARIKDGIIRIPEKYRKGLKENVKVILLTEYVSHHHDMIEELMESPIKLSDFIPFEREEIYDRS